MSLALTDQLAWVVVALFAASVVLAGRRETIARYVAVAAWVSFAVFWALLVNHFAFVEHSPIEGLLSALAVPGCLYAGVLAYRARRGMRTLQRAITVMGVVYLPFLTIRWLHVVGVHAVVGNVNWLVTSLGYHFQIITENVPGDTFLYTAPDGHRYETTVLLACTGVGSMAVVTGLIAAVDASVRRRVKAFCIALPIIYVLNVLRVSFIALSLSQQWFAGPVFQAVIRPLFGVSSYSVSYIVADRIISQSLSVIALVLITLGLMRILPELAGFLESLLEVATGKEYDFQGLSRSI